MYDLLMCNTEPSISIDALNQALLWRGWSPARLAKESEVSKGMVSLILSGERPNASAVVVAKLARALNVSVDFLLGFTDDPLPKGINLSQTLIELLEAAKTLPESRQRDLLLIASAYAEAGEPTPEIMDMVLSKIEEIGGEEALNEVLDLLESLLPSSPHHRKPRGSSE